MDEPIAVSPLWLEYSGLPRHLNEAVRAGAWPVFKKLVELDCQQNAIPDIIEAAAADLAEWTGLKADAVSKILAKLRSAKYVAGYIADHPEEVSLFQIQIPLRTPRTPAETIRDSGKAFFHPGMRLRYGYPLDAPPDDETRLQQVVDLYFNHISMRMNSFILDELRMVARRFSLESARGVFGRAALNETRSLAWAIRELVKERRGDGENTGE